MGIWSWLSKSKKPDNKVVETDEPIFNEGDPELELLKMLSNQGMLFVGVPEGSKSAPQGPKRPLVYMFTHRAIRDAAFTNHPELIKAFADERCQLEPEQFESCILSYYVARAEMICDDLGLEVPDMWDDMTFENMSESQAEEIEKQMNLFQKVVIHPIKRNGYTCYVIVMPKPLHATEAHYGGVVFKDDEPHRYPEPSPSTSYYTLEYSDMMPFPYFCEWDREGKHHNIEAGPQPEINRFADIVFKHYFQTHR